MNVKNTAIIVCVFIAAIACKDNNETTLSGLKKADFTTEVDGQNINLYTLKNKNGVEACITNYGGRLVSLMIPDRNGNFEDIVCGFPTIADYLENRQNFGATIGRYIDRKSVV